MPDYGLTRDFIAVTPSGIVAIRSGSKTDPTTAISASIPQVLAITCSSNFNNRLTKLTTLNAFGVITLTSGSRNSNDNRIILRYIDSSSRGIIETIDDAGLGNDGESVTKDLSFQGTGINDTIVDIPINSNDDSFLVAYRTVEALNNVSSFNSSFRATIVDEGSSLSSLTASIGNMTIGSGFKIRNSASLGINSLTDGGEGKFTITSLNSGALASPDFSGTQVQVGGMMIGSSFKVGGSPDTFNFNIITSGSGKMNQRFYPGKLFLASASLVQRMDPDDKKSFEFLVPSQSVGGDDDLVPLYISSSRRIGFATKDPLTDVDIRADEFQIQRKTERRGLKINTEGNIESFDKNAATAATGSEFILKYSRGISITKEFVNTIFGQSFGNDTDAQNFFNALKPDIQQSGLEKGERAGFISPPQVGDTLGQIRWVAESGSIGDFDERVAGETATIKAVVSDGASDGISADLIFSVADKTGTSQQKLLLDAGNLHQLTGSLNVFGNITTAGFIQPRPTENTQTRIDFSNSGVDIDFYSNTTEVLKLSNTGIIFNDNSNDVDLRIEGNGDANLFVTNAGTDKVGIGTNAPGEKLEVVGNISASGTITALSSNIVTIDGGSF